MTPPGEGWRDSETQYEDSTIGEDTIPQMFEAAADRYGPLAAQSFKGGVYERSLADELPTAAADEYASISYDRMRELVRLLAAGFRELGVTAGTRAGIYCSTRLEWTLCDFGLLGAAGVVTTVYTESSADQLRYLLADPDARAVVVENEQLLERLLSVEQELTLELIVVVDEFEGYADRDDIYSLGEVLTVGERVFDQSAYESWVAERTPEDLASLIYTSGTTGEPKGVKLTHGNFRANVNQCRKRFAGRPDRPSSTPRIEAGARSLSFLPLAHVFERLAGSYLMFASGVTVAYAESADTLAEDIQTVRPTIATSVPRVYERIFSSMREQAPESYLGRRLFAWALRVARESARDPAPGFGLRLQHRIADRLVYSSVRDQLGGNIELMVSGGGSLSTRLAELFQGMGIPLLEGYGLTETAPVLSTNPPEDPRPGTLGVPVPGVEVRLDTDRGPSTETVGELLVRGPNVSSGYWNRPDATARAFTEDGWFRTGDLVEQTDDAFLIFHERLKQLLVLDTGKNVAPARIEDGFATNERIDQIMAVGDSQKFVSALVVPDIAAVTRWAREQGIPIPDDEWALCEDSRVREMIDAEIQRVNEGLEKHERVQAFRMVTREWTPDNGLLTPSMKLKRRSILGQHQQLVESIYGARAADEQG